MLSSQKWKRKIIFLKNIVPKDLIGGAVERNKGNLFSSFATGPDPEPLGEGDGTEESHSIQTVFGASQVTERWTSIIVAFIASILTFHYVSLT